MLRAPWLVVVVGALSLGQAFAAPRTNKTLRVEHGRPILLVSEQSVLLLEFLKEPIADAIVPHPEPDVRHCRARYRYQFYDAATRALTNGQGVVEEIYQTVSSSPAGREIKDMGSRVGISAGDFYVWWSVAGAGERSWIYYRSDSPIRFIQQPQQITFESVGREQFQNYLQSRNVQEFVAAGKTVHVLGPAVFSGDLPTERAASARIASGQVRESAFELKLASLVTNTHYIIESSYELKTGTWTPVHTFVARGSDYEWADPLGKGVDMAYYRIREGAY